MTISRVLRWPLRLPLLKVSSREEKIMRAIEIAQMTEEMGESYITYVKHEIGYVDIAICRQNGKTMKWVRITNRVHFQGPYTKVPDIEVGRMIKFKSRMSPLPNGNPLDSSSYLEIEYVR